MPGVRSLTRAAPVQSPPDRDPAEILADIAGGRAPEGGPGPNTGRRGSRSSRDWARLLNQLGIALAASARTAGAGAVSSGRWLADVVVDTAPRLPVRDLETLERHHPGLGREQLADALVSSAARATTAVGIGGGALTGVQWSVPVTLVAVPLQLAVEVAAVAAIEIKLVAELHEVYGAAVRGSASQRGTAYALSWANRRGVNPLEPASLGVAMGVVARKRVQRRLIARAGRGIGTLAPLMAGAVYGAVSNRKQTLLLADSLRGDLRRRPLVTGLTGAATGLAVARFVEPSVRRSLRLLRRPRPPGGS